MPETGHPPPPPLVAECAERLALVRARIGEARAAARSRAGAILAPETALLAVSKGHPADRVAAFHALGVRDFGENYAQELVGKARVLREAGGYDDIRWHFVGHLQSNKAKDVLPLVSHVHGLDRPSLLDALERHASPARGVRVYLQLVVDPADEGKHGAAPDVAQALARRLGSAHAGAASGLEWAGFMGIGPADAQAPVLDALYADFRGRALALWNAHHPRASREAPGFSLGMSGDLDGAIANGSTLVRVGTALFGARPPKGTEAR